MANVDSDLIKNQLHLPEPNEFIATDFSLLEDSGEPKDYPRLWIDADVCQL